MSSDRRNDNGQFAAGNPGGPGRPRRTIEREYLAALSEVVTRAKWREVIERTLADALAGDAKAREFLARYVIGSDPPTLLDLAASELRGRTVDQELDDTVKRHDQDAKRQAQYDALLGRPHVRPAPAKLLATLRRVIQIDMPTPDGVTVHGQVPFQSIGLAAAFDS